MVGESSGLQTHAMYLSLLNDYPNSVLWKNGDCGLSMSVGPVKVALAVVPIFRRQTSSSPFHRHSYTLTQAEAPDHRQ